MALAALVLIVLTFGPSLDSLVCQGERGLSVSAAELSVSSAMPDPDERGHPGDGACIHGHCHHGGSYVPASPVAAEAPGRLAAVDLRPARARVRTSDPKFGLMRPPRA
jgi:hypothetical protein